MPVHPSKLRKTIEQVPKNSRPCAPDVRAGEVAPDCASCPFAVKGVPHHRPVRPLVPSTKIVGVLVGEGPGHDEAIMGEPFVGMTGDELNMVLAENNLARSKLIIVNAMGCMPPSGQRTEPNMRAAANACKPWMRSILRNRIRPGRQLSTLAMGKWAGFLITGKARAIGDARGFVRRLRGRYSPLILTWHPTFALFRNPWVQADFEADVDRFSRATRNELEPLPRAITKPTLRQIHGLWEEPYITVDIETGARSPEESWTGKDATQATLKVVGLGTRNTGYAMWWQSTSIEIKREVKRLLASKRILKVLQNGHWFDRRILKRYGFRIRNMIDTRDMRRALSTTSRLSLGYMSSIYLDFPAWKEKIDDGKE